MLDETQEFIYDGHKQIENCKYILFNKTGREIQNDLNGKKDCLYAARGAVCHGLREYRGHEDGKCGDYCCIAEGRGPDTVTYKGRKYKVTEIAAKAFYKNKKLTKVTIGKNVRTIGKSAFEGCAKLKDITIRTTKLTKAGIGKNSFKCIVKKAVIKCPKKKLEDYMAWMKKPGGAPKMATWKK